MTQFGYYIISMTVPDLAKGLNIYPFRLLFPYAIASFVISFIPYGKPYSAILSMNGSGSKASGPSTPTPFH
jgi:hypothetical protein